jgi:uncharacterized protein YlzI (FlbEa/FlbD family)
MIEVNPAEGGTLFLNEDLIEHIAPAEPGRRTVVTLVDGKRLEVADDAEELVERALRYRAAVLAALDELRPDDPLARRARHSQPR